MGEDADWALLESNSGGPGHRASQPMAELLTPYRDAVLSAPRSMTGGTRSVSTGESVWIGEPVRTDTESARTILMVRADSRPAWTGRPVRAGQEQPPTTPAGWSKHPGGVERAGCSGRSDRHGAS